MNVFERCVPPCVRKWILGLALALAACQGSDPDAPPPVTSVIGAAGGTVVGPSGAQVEIPPEALAQDTTIGIAQSSDGAPALPADVTAVGSIFAFTPHGTSFAVPATITVPFDAAAVPAGTAPALYKTNAQGAWDEVPGATVNGGSMSGQVTGFSYAAVVTPPVTRLPDLTEKDWDLETAGKDALIPLDKDMQGPGALDVGFEVGRELSVNPYSPGPAEVSVHVNGSGSTYWTLAEAPSSSPDAVPRLDTSSSELNLYLTFEKNVEDATLTIIVTESRLEKVDDGGRAPQPICNWVSIFAPEETFQEECWPKVLVARNEFLLSAAHVGADEGFYDIAGTAQLSGPSEHHKFEALGERFSRQLWTDKDFDVETTVNGSKRHALVKLKQPKRIQIPLEEVHAPGGRFNVHVNMKSSASSLLQGETYAGAYLRDPQEIKGIAFESTGLTQLPGERFVVADPAPVPCDSGIDPEAGTLQLAAPEFREPELPDGARVFVERSGGSKGDVAVRVETEDGTAVAGSDYQPVSTVVRFADGEDGTRTVRVPLVVDDVEEPDKTVKLKLTRIRGCAALGEQSSGILSILYDDHHVVVPTYTVGGAVTGLEGTGLTLREEKEARDLTPGNGAFTFQQQYLSGAPYEVRVTSQPVNPAQVCTVTHGSGTIADANVADIAIDCVTQQANGALDPSFGEQGKIQIGAAAAKAIALQADGKLLAVGKMSLTRTNADGSLDVGFGTGGKVAIVANGGPTDAMQAVAVQADGKIVVAGHTAPPTVFNDDFVILRYHPDGSPDTDFGDGGKVVIDFNGMTDQASAVLVQGDGKIVAAGYAVVGTIFDGDLDFAVVRLLPDGTPDPAFGSGGKATANVAGNSDFGTAAALAPDGKIVVVGRVFSDATDQDDFGVTRFLADGTVDLGFGTDGTVRIDFSEGGVVPPTFTGGLSDEPSDVAVQPDGRIVIVGRTRIDTIYRFGLARLTGDGAADTSFGTGGLVSTPFAPGGDEAAAVAFSPDGRIVVAGLTAPSGTSDFAIARYTAVGALDPSFGDGGLVTVDFFGGFDSAIDVLIQPDGKIVAGGKEQNGASNGLGLARVLP